MFLVPGSKLLTVYLCPIKFTVKLYVLYKCDEIRNPKTLYVCDGTPCIACINNYALTVVIPGRNCLACVNLGVKPFKNKSR